jgi:hypothetical protein
MSVVKRRCRDLAKRLVLVLFHNNEAIAKDISEERTYPLRLRKVITAMDEEVSHEARAHQGDLVA